MCCYCVKAFCILRSATLTQDNKVVLQQCERLFQEAIRRRAKYDAQKKESDRVLSLEQVRLQKEPDIGTAAVKTKTISNNTLATTSSKINPAANHGSSSSNSEDIVNLDEIDLEDLVGGSIATVAVAPVKAGSLVEEEMQTATATVETLESPNAFATIQPDIVSIVGSKRPLSAIASSEEPVQTGDARFDQLHAPNEGHLFLIRNNDLLYHLLSLET